MNSLDKLGLAITNAGYVWTPEMREVYETGVKELKQLEILNKQPTKVIAMPELLESCGWVRKKEWVGLTDEEIDGWKIVGHESLREFVRAIEAKLKEKNT